MEHAGKSDQSLPSRRLLLSKKQWVMINALLRFDVVKRRNLVSPGRNFGHARPRRRRRPKLRRLEWWLLQLDSCWCGWIDHRLIGGTSAHFKIRSEPQPEYRTLGPSCVSTENR